MPPGIAAAAGAAGAIVHGILTGAWVVRSMVESTGFFAVSTAGGASFMSWSIPVLPGLGIALLSALVLAALTLLASRLGPAAGRALRLGYAGGGLAMIVAAFVLAAGPRGFDLGPIGWVVLGGADSAFQLCVLVALALLLADRARAWSARAARTRPADAPEA
ncbi:hypothetical protein [Brachybacterium phenoliresistens]|uniref:hypothetical protein n=1 Tax=Brachybacterium phenoliresistens TaxID=396014 RepID=UPI0031E413BF